MEEQNSSEVQKSVQPPIAPVYSRSFVHVEMSKLLKTSELSKSNSAIHGRILDSSPLASSGDRVDRSSVLIATALEGSKTSSRARVMCLEAFVHRA